MLLSKIAWTLVLGAVLLVPLWSIEGKIHERQGRAIGVADELAASGVGEQAVSGPVFVRPCSERFRAEREDDEGKTHIVTLVRDCSARYVPRTLGIDGTLATEVRERGIYRTLFYGAGLVLDGSVDLPPLAGPAADVIDRAVGDLELRMGISDVRGIDAGSNLQWGAQAVAFAPGSRDASLGRGVHARLPGVAPGNHRFRVRLQLRGTRSLQFVPLARDTRIALRGSWPHPSFHGRFLPQARTVQGSGFAARWQVSELASDAVGAFIECAGTACPRLHEERIGLALIEPVDLYVQSLRAVDYGFLFVGLTFLVFLLFELVAALRLHPMQYALVGLALAVFFLLLFALAEHIAFELAYAIASGACILLIGFYVSHILGSALRAAAFSTYLVGLYGALYMLLRSEDSAMLLGALLVFAVLALTMVLTRRLDWHKLVQARMPKLPDPGRSPLTEARGPLAEAQRPDARVVGVAPQDGPQ